MGTLKILVTGAGGSLGAACVEEALARGHAVVALTRHPSEFPSGVTVWTCDLTDGLPREALAGVDAVIHTAASMSNDPATLERDTIEATKALRSSIERLPERPLVVLASTILVYDAELAQPVNVDESTALERRVESREPYLRAKMTQEQCLQDSGLTTWALRIGAVYNDGIFWNAHIGFRSGRILVSLGRAGEVPMVHVKDAASALVNAAQTKPQGLFEALNIVEDSLPSRRDVIAALAPAIHLPFHWRLLMPFAHVVHKLCGPDTPGLLQPRILRARMANRTYDNSKAKQRLGWRPERHFSASTGTPGRPT